MRSADALDAAPGAAKMNSINAAKVVIGALSSTDGFVTGGELAEKLGLEYATVKRAVARLRKQLDAPIVSCISGYAWRPAPHQYDRAKALVTVFGSAK